MRTTKKFAIQLVITTAIITGFTLLAPLGVSADTSTDVYDLPLSELFKLEIETASKGKTKISETAAIVSVVTREEIKNLGAQNLQEVLNLVAGVEVNRAVMFGVHNTIGIRGRMTDFGEDVLVLIDGQRMNDVYTGGGLHQLKTIRTSNIERIELIRGPGSTLFGSNAFVGIVNVITRNRADEARSHLRAYGGSFDQIGGDFRIAHHTDSGLKVALYGEIWTDDGDSYSIDRGFLRPPVALPSVGDPVDQAFDVGFDFEWHDFFLQLNYSERELDGFMPWGFLDDAWNSAILDTNQDDSEVFRVQAKYEWKPLDNLSITPSIKYFQGSIDQLYFLAAPGVPPFSPGTSVATFGWVGSPTHETSNLEYELQVNYSIGDHDIVGGAVVQEEELKYADNLFTFYPFPTALPVVDFYPEVHTFSGAEGYADPRERDSWGVYLQDTWRINEKIGVTAGVRYDDYSDFGNTINPRLGLVYNFSEELHFKLLYGQAYRAPTFNELYVRNNPVQLGNPDLEPQSIETYEFFVGYSPTPELSGSISVYYNEYEDLIKLVPAAPLPTYQNASESETDIGVELEVKYQTSENAYAMVSYAYIDPDDSDGGKRAHVARHKVNATLNYELWDRVNLNLNGFYFADRGDPSGAINDDYDNDVILNANIRIKEIIGPADLGFSFHNILDKQWESPGYSPVLTPENVPNRGFRFLATVSLEF